MNDLVDDYLNDEEPENPEEPERPGSEAEEDDPARETLRTYLDRHYGPEDPSDTSD